jgi:hypothetical protein
MTIVTRGSLTRSKLLALALLSAVVSVVSVAAPAVAEASSAQRVACRGTVTRSTNVAKLHAYRISVDGGLTCKSGRRVIRSFFGRVIRDSDCLYASQFAGGGCISGSYICFRGNIGVPRNNACVGSGGRSVYWRERDFDVSGG